MSTVNPRGSRVIKNGRRVDQPSYIPVVPVNVQKVACKDCQHLIFNTRRGYECMCQAHEVTKELFHPIHGISVTHTVKGILDPMQHNWNGRCPDFQLKEAKE